MAPLFCMIMAFTSLRLCSRSIFAEPQVPAMFVFGDSLIDPGNNNNLMSLAKANYYPYGIDFPEGPTGRFCNGRTIADYLGNFLGLPLIPPYNNPEIQVDDMLQGVNFASAGAGILNDTGYNWVEVISMDSQIQNFKETLEALASVLEERMKDYIGRSIFLVYMGNNDYLNNFLLPLSEKPDQYTPEAYAELVSHEYSRQLKELYDLGGRKFLVPALAPLGCIPTQIAISQNASDTCVESVNTLILQFNTKLKAMVADLNRSLPGSYFLFWDSYSVIMDIINNYSTYGFKYPHTACCGLGRAHAWIVCLPNLPLECQNRAEFVFWDFAHPTDRTNSFISKHAYSGTVQPFFPMNLMQLALA